MLKTFCYPRLLHLYEFPNQWIMEDGASPHFGILVRDYLDEKFGGQWIGPDGGVAWPQRSPDLTPCDFGLWGYVK